MHTHRSLHVEARGGFGTPQNWITGVFEILSLLHGCGNLNCGLYDCTATIEPFIKTQGNISSGTISITLSHFNRSNRLGSSLSHFRFEVAMLWKYKNHASVELHSIAPCNDQNNSPHFGTCMYQLLMLWSSKLQSAAH